MRLGSKKIFHLEAWVIKVMTLYKVCGQFQKYIVQNSLIDKTFSILSVGSRWTTFDNRLYNATCSDAAYFFNLL